MTLENDSEYEMTHVWIARFEDTIRRLEALRETCSADERAGTDTEISGYRYMIRDMKRQMADYEARTGALAKAV
jgi:hypothetical protein